MRKNMCIFAKRSGAHMRNGSPTLAYPPHFFKLLIEISRTLNLLGLRRFVRVRSTTALRNENQRSRRTISFTRT